MKSQAAERRSATRASAGFVGAPLLEDYVAARQQAMGDGDQRDAVGLALGELALEVGGEVRVARVRTMGGEEERAAQVGRAALGDVLASAAELPRLEDTRVQAGVGHQR